MNVSTSRSQRKQLANSRLVRVIAPFILYVCTAVIQICKINTETLLGSDTEKKKEKIARIVLYHTMGFYVRELGRQSEMCLSSF